MSNLESLKAQYAQARKDLQVLISNKQKAMAKNRVEPNAQNASAYKSAIEAHKKGIAHIKKVRTQYYIALYSEPQAS